MLRFALAGLLPLPLLLSPLAHGSSASTLPPPAIAPRPQPQPLLELQAGARQLMIDRSMLDEGATSSAAVIKMHPPRKTGKIAIKADKPWEELIFYYDSIVQVSTTEFRIYYDAFGPAGRFMCVALSNDTVTWTKPNVGLVEFANSTDNNILLGAGGYIEPGVVFLDTNPAAEPTEKYKMVRTLNNAACIILRISA